MNMQISELAAALKPYVLRWLDGKNAAAGGGGVVVLDESQYPEALLRDGTRSILGNVTVAPNVLIDGVDIDAFAANTLSALSVISGRIDTALSSINLNNERYLLLDSSTLLNRGRKLVLGTYLNSLEDGPARTWTLRLDASTTSDDSKLVARDATGTAFAKYWVARGGLYPGYAFDDRTTGSAGLWELYADGGAAKLWRGADKIAFDSAGNGSARSAAFASGFAGSGWRVDSGIANTGRTTLEVDDAVVRGNLRVYELLIDKIRVGLGNQLFSSGGGKIKTVSGAGPYTIEFEDDHGLAVNDLLRAQRFTGAVAGQTTGGGTYQSQMTVASVVNTTTITATLNAGTAPAIGFEYVQLGNTSNAARRGSFYLATNDTNAPYLDVIDGVAAHADWGSTSKTKARLGKLDGIADPLFGSLTGYGLYANNIYLTGAIRAMSGRIDGVLDIGTAGEIRQGTGTWGTDFTGLREWNDSGVGRIAGYNNQQLQWYGSTDGKFYAAGGLTKLDATGLALDPASASGGYVPARSVRWENGSGVVAGFVDAYADGVSKSIGINSLSAYNGDTRTPAVALLADYITATGFERGTFSISKNAVTMSARTKAGVPINSSSIFVSTNTGYLARIETGRVEIVLNQLTASGADQFTIQRLSGDPLMRFSEQGLFFIGDFSTDYSPTATKWTNGTRDFANIVLNGLDYSTIAFHDSGSRVDAIRAGGGVIETGFDAGWGAARVHAPGKLSVAPRTVASNAAGVAGEIAWDTQYIYVCTAANTWKRINAALVGY